MAPGLLRVAAEQGLFMEGRGGERARWRAHCQRCSSWLEIVAKPPEPVWALRRMCAFAARHRHRRAATERGGGR